MSSCLPGRRNLLIAAWFLVLASVAAPALALPRFSLTAGSRCSNCHVNPQGSGIRSELGWYSTNTLGAVTWDKLGLKALHDVESNAFFDGKVIAGLDARLQLTRLGRPTLREDGTVKVPDRIAFPMQIAPGVAIAPLPGVTLAGHYNVATLKHSYPGQVAYDATVRWAPDHALPYVRAGMMQPSFGLRWDDHTMLLRSNPADPKTPLIAPAWADVGAEVGYEGLHWLSAEASAFQPRNLADSVGSKYIAGNDVGFSGRVTVSPRLDDWEVNTMLGASILHAGDFQMEDVFVGIGKSYWGSLIAEGTHTSAGTRKTTTGALVAAWDLREWLSLQGRAERGTGDDGDKHFKTTTYVATIQFMPVPYVELRPEYRWLDTDKYKLAQYTLQTHLYF